MKQTTIQLDSQTQEQMAQLAEWWGLPPQRHMTPIIQKSVQQMIVLESARRTLSDAEFVGFLAELYRPV